MDGGEPVLRPYADLDPGLRGLTAGQRVLAHALISDPAVPVRTVVESPWAVAPRVNEHTVLISVLADDAARAVRLGQLCKLCTKVRI